MVLRLGFGGPRLGRRLGRFGRFPQELTLMDTAASAPAPLWTIALLALAPFPISAALYAYGPETVAHGSLTALLSWSALVLSFLGGVRWGLESARDAPRWTRLWASVVSSVAAWGL